LSLVGPTVTDDRARGREPYAHRVRRLRVTVLVLVATALALAALTGVERDAAASTEDAFYQPPSPLPKQPPGTIIRSEPVPAPAGATAWKVLYHSRSIDRRRSAVSGVIIVPNAPAPEGGRPVVTWAHGTTGLADPCAPSKASDVTTRMIPFVPALVAAGYVVVATDYEGLGTPGVHPYLVGTSEGRGVLDAARAAQRFAAAQAGGQVVVAGHSQGGHAALFAGELAKRYAPELDVRGVVAIAPVADVEAFLHHTANFPGAAGFVVMGLEGLHAAVPALDLSAIVTPEAWARWDTVTTKCADDVMAAFFDLHAAELAARDPFTTPELVRRWREHSAGRRRSVVPVLVVQGSGDFLVPAALTEAFVARACGRGSTVDSRLYDADHLTILDAAQGDIVAWLRDRVDGQPARTTCS
jgi:pimeloyl-ACP methyl ester carboxylesterase